MTPERVLAALVAHTQAVDLRRPDPLVMTERHAPAKQGTAWERYLTDDERAAARTWHGIRTALARETRRVRKTEAHEFAVDALSGMPTHCLRTLYSAIRADSAARTAIAGKLERLAMRSRKHDNFWPDAIKRSPAADGRKAHPDYLPDLVELAIRELEYPGLINTHMIRAEWFGTKERNWYLVARRPYELLSGNLWMWYHSGVAHMQRRIARGRRLAEAS